MIYFDPGSDGFFDTRFNRRIPESSVPLTEEQVNVFYYKNDIPEGMRRKKGTLELENIPSVDYEVEYDRVDSIRRAAYFNIVTPLTDEAYIKRNIIKTPESIAEAEQLEQQALAARYKIQADNPWPTLPEV